VSSLYVVAVAAALGTAAWLQVRVPISRPYRLLSWGTALIFALILAPAAVASPDIETLSQLGLLVALPLIAVPYQVRMMRLIGGSRKRSPSDTPGTAVRGPGGGRVRHRGRRAR
jgi:hypothetical protein